MPNQIVFEENFKSGHYLPDPVRDNMRVPVGWQLWFADGSTPRIERQDHDWTPPELEIKSRHQLHVSEVGSLLEGDEAANVYHEFKGYGRIWRRLQRRFDLPIGRYEFQVRLWPDILSKQENVWGRIVKTPAPDPLTGEFRFFRDGAFTTWLTGADVPFAKYTTVSNVWQHAGGPVDLGYEVRCRWGVPVVGWFTRWVKIVRLDAAPPPPPDPDTVTVSRAEIESIIDRLKAWLPSTPPSSPVVWLNE